MTATDVASAARALLETERSHVALPALSEGWRDLDVATACAIQDEVVSRKIRDHGEQIVGVKLGLTSEAKQRQMNVSSPITGWLTDMMALSSGEALNHELFIHPRCEPEIVFVMKRALEGPGVTPVDALNAVEAVYAGLEVIDSRYLDFQFTLPDVIADNASSAAFAMSVEGTSADALDLRLEACLFERNGQLLGSATGAAIRGHPAYALASAVNDLAAHGRRIEAGWIVLTGGMTDAFAIQADEIMAAHFTTIGSVAIG